MMSGIIGSQFNNRGSGLIKSQLITASISGDAITGAQIADDTLDSEHYVAGSVDLEHMSSQSVDEDNLHISNAGSNGQFLSKQSGNAGGLTWADAGGGSWNLIATADASSSASLTVTGIDSTYDTYAVAVSQMIPATNNVDFYLRFGDSSGVDSGASDYAYHASGGRAGASTARTAYSGGAAQIAFKLTGDGIGNLSTQSFGMMAFLHNPSDSTAATSLSGTYWYMPISTLIGDGGSFGGNRTSVISHDRVNVQFSSGNIASGRLTVWGIAHA
jgi:hypothetical protein